MSKTNLRLIVVVSAVITAFIHLALAFLLDEQMMQILFALNGIGFLTLTYIWLKPPAVLRRWAVWLHYAFIAFSAVTILGYFAVNGMAKLFADPLGLFTKLAEVVLMIALWRHGKPQA